MFGVRIAGLPSAPMVSKRCWSVHIHEDVGAAGGVWHRMVLTGNLIHPLLQRLGVLRHGDLRLFDLRVPFLFPLGADVAFVAVAHEQGEDIAAGDFAFAHEYELPFAVRLERAHLSCGRA